MTIMRALVAMTTFAACAGSSSSGNQVDAPSGTSDAPAATDAPADSDQSHYRTSLASCWTDTSCKRALLVAHGGEWKLADPAYGSTAAYDAAYADGADAIKADVRFSKDGVPVVVHSSPFASYEIDPLDFSCLGATVEDMTASDIVACRWINGDHIQRLDALLAWAHDKVIIMLTIKDLTTTAQVIEAVVSLGATDRVFVELPASTMLSVVPTLPDHDEVYYVVEAASQADITSLLAQHDSRAFLYEDANSDNFGGMAAADVTAMITNQLYPAHVRAFSSISSVGAAASDHQALWDRGFDVVMSNSYSSGHDARVAVNTARGISPP